MSRRPKLLSLRVLDAAVKANVNVRLCDWSVFLSISRHHSLRRVGSSIPKRPKKVPEKKRERVVLENCFLQIPICSFPARIFLHWSVPCEWENCMDISFARNRQYFGHPAGIGA